ncbi:MAG: nitrile hydratase accessory protein [Betaproteobacteria bacterium]|nr:nitrile hydratase accessory protein [Betaproteobacteria bacterium]
MGGPGTRGDARDGGHRDLEHRHEPRGARNAAGLFAADLLPDLDRRAGEHAGRACAVVARRIGRGPRRRHARAPAAPAGRGRRAGRTGAGIAHRAAGHAARALRGWRHGAYARRVRAASHAAAGLCGGPHRQDRARARHARICRRARAGFGREPATALHGRVRGARAVGGSGGAGPVRFRGRVGTVPGAGVIDPAACPGLPRDDADEPVFRAPWEAHAFALVVQLHERGLFTWPEWAAALSAQIRAAQAAGDADLGDTYYRHWLAALEALVAAKGGRGTVLCAGGRRGSR